MKTSVAFVASVLAGGVANLASAANAPPRPTGRRTMRRLLAGIVVLTSAMLITVAPADAAGRGGRGGGFHGGGFHGGGGFHHGFRGGFHHGGFHRFGCCFGPAFVGGVFVGSALAYPYYGYPYYGYPYYAYPYAYPSYSEPIYQPQPQLSVAPSIQREVCYVGGCYRLQGDGVTVAYRWIWIPTVPSPPPAPPAAPPNGPPSSGAAPPDNSVSSRPTQQLYRWVDERGVANWTNNRQAVPRQYRSQVQ